MAWLPDQFGWGLISSAGRGWLPGYRAGWAGFRRPWVLSFLLAGLWWHLLGLAAAAGMAVLLIGAVITHRRAADNGKQTAPALLALALAYLAVSPAG